MAEASEEKELFWGVFWTSVTRVNCELGILITPRRSSRDDL